MIKLYTTHCPQCRTLEMKLDKKAIQYETCEDTAAMKELGFKAAPMLQVDDQYLNFSQAIKWVNAQ